MVLLVAACSAVDSTPTTLPTTTAFVTPTTATTTTTTTTSTTTTTTLINRDFDWSQLTFEDMVNWGMTNIPMEANLSVGFTCEGDFLAFSIMGEILVSEVEPMLQTAVDVENGSGTVADASVAFINWADAAVVRYSLASIAESDQTDVDSLLYVHDLVDPSFTATSAPSIIGELGYDAETGQINQYTVDQWLPLLTNAALEIQSQSVVLPGSVEQTFCAP